MVATRGSGGRLAALAVGMLLLTTACGGGSTPVQGGAITCVPAPAGETVNLNFYSWVPGMQDVVSLWNKENPTIQVTLATGPSGPAGAYQNYSNSIKAGNAPDLMQIEYDTLPNFRIQDGVANIGSCPGVAEVKSQFVDWTWAQTSFGEQDAAFAIPQDTGPMAFFYRKDLFEQNNIPVPTTWDEFKTAAQAIATKGDFITNFSSANPGQFAAFVWQAGGNWFAGTDQGWKVQLTSPKSVDVANYWQGLLDARLVAPMKTFTDEWNKAINSGEVWGWVSAVWGNATIKTNAPDTAGKWAVAAMPQWTAGGKSAGNWGGSSTAVFKGSKHPAEAAKFAVWLNTNTEALTMLNAEGGLYPATTAGQDLPALQQPSDFFGGQDIFAVFKQASSQVDPNWIWGPVMNETYNTLTDGFGAALNGQGTLGDALGTAQSKTLDAMDAQAIPVVGS